jgi:hypothetical protein
MGPAPVLNSDDENSSLLSLEQKVQKTFRSFSFWLRVANKLPRKKISPTAATSH